jgi:serine/threonine-protein kinase
MVNNDLGGGSFGKTVLLQDPFIDELLLQRNMNLNVTKSKNSFIRTFSTKSKFSIN